MPAPYSAGSIWLQVLPSFKGVPEQIAREAREWGESAGKGFDENFERNAVQGAKETGRKVGKALSDEVGTAGKTAAERFSDVFERDTRAKKLFQSVEKDADEAGKKAAKAMGSHFDSTVKRLHKSLTDRVATIKVNADDKQAQAVFRQLQRDIALLDAQAEIGMDINPGTTMQVIQRINGALHDLQDTADNIKARVDFANVYSEGTKVEAYLKSLSAITIEPELKIDRQMGAFERGLRGAMESALRDLGTVDVGVGSSAGQRAVAELRRQLLELSDREVGVDISAETARERLAQIRDDLEQIQREHWSVDLDANTAAASAALTGILASLESIDGRNVDIDIDVKDAVSAMTTLKAVGGAANQTEGAIARLSGTTQDGANSFRAFNVRVLGVAALGPLVVPALGAIAAAIGALGPLAAVGAAGLGALTLGLFGVGDAFKAMGDARTSSAKDMEDYARGVRTAASGVEDAERGIADARESAARSNEAAGRQVENALRGVEDAERNLRSAQQDAESAQRDLIRAREDAAEQLEDLQLRVRDGALDQRQATLDLREAEDELAEARREGLQGDDLERYILALDRAKLRVDQTAESNGDLAAEQAKWAKGGVEGSDVVVAAQERVQQSQERIADAERGMVDAQRALGDARAEQARTAVDGQRQIADAQRRLTEAQLAYSEAITATSTSQDKLTESMAKLGPAGREFVTFLDGLRPKFQGLRAIAQEGLLPGLTDWIDSMVNYHGPLLESTVGRISGAIGRMFSAFGESIRGQAFTDLFQMIDRSGPTFIRQMSDILVNLGEGVASLIVAMEPMSRLFGEWLVNATARFSEWAANLRGSSGLQDFFEWVQRVGPKVAEFFWEFADALIAIGIAIAPFAERMLDGLINFFDWISNLDPNILGPVVVGILTLTVALQAIFGLTALMYSFRSALHLTTGALGAFSSGAGGLKGAAGQFGILGVALATIYTQSEAARGAIDGIIEALGNLISWVASWMPDLTSLATTLALVAASWKAASVIGGGFTLLGAAAGNASGKLGQMAMNMTGSVDAGLKTMTTMDRVGKALGFLGRALPIVGIGFGILGAIFEDNTRKIEENRRELYGWMEATSQGGRKADEAAQKLAEYRTKIDDLQASIAAFDEQEGGGTSGDFTGAIAGQRVSLEQLREDLAETTKEWEDYWNSLTPVEQANARITAAQRDLQEVLKTHPVNSKAARDASAALAVEEEKLAVLEGRLKEAISGVNQEMLIRQGLAIDLAGAEMAYEQSTNALADARQRYLDVLKDPEATEEQARQALEAWHNQALATAESAKRLTEAKYADADANVRTQMGNAAYLLELERQKELYGELPPALEKVRQELQLTVPEPYKIAAGFDALTLAISETPSEKGIVISADTVPEKLQQLRDMGFEIREMPDGQFEVIALTDAAKAAIDDLLTPRTLEITTTILGGSRTQRSIDRNQQAGRSYTGVIPEYASGGFVRGTGGPTSDSIPAWLSNGEFVVRAASVSKYGLGLLDAINQGQFQSPTGFAAGGLATRPKRKNGRPAFAEGGYVATYGGSINLGGLAIPELASFWVETVSTIQQASGMAAEAISRTFLTLRNAILGNFMATGVQARASWALMMTGINGEVDRGAMAVGARVNSLQAELSLRFALMRIASVDNWSGMWKALQIVTDNGSTNIGQRTASLQAELGLRFTLMRIGIVDQANETVRQVGEAWNRLPGLIVTPVNKIIDSVINGGLVTAFNSLLGQLGTGGTPLTGAKTVKLGTGGTPLTGAKTVKLAAGGKVPGHSPNDKADNIPAWLTAGEFVQPVDVVRHYGVDFMERLRKKELPRYATGGYVEMSNTIKKQFPWARITSTLRPGDPGWHGKGRAIDIAGAAPYPNPVGVRQILEINRWIAATFSNITELIHTQPGAINLYKGKPYTYNPRTQAEHRNHVHWAMAGALLGGGGNFAGMLGGGFDVTGTLNAALEKALKGFGTSPAEQIMAGVPRKLSTIMAERLNKLMEEAVFSMGDASAASSAGLSGDRGANKTLAQRMAAARGWTGGEWAALDTLIMKESGYNNTAQNPTSTAFGIGQFLNSTWAPYGPKTSDPAKQLDYMYRYIGDRYGSPSRALAFHRSNNWYGEGGEVQPNQGTDATGAIIPDLHDTGGWIQPGLNVLMNRTGRPEPVINPQTLDALVGIAERGDGNADHFHWEPVVMQGATAEEMAREMMHRVTVEKRGGRRR